MKSIKVQAIQEDSKKEDDESMNLEDSEEVNEELEKPLVKTKASQKMVSCPNCNKSMLNKTYRYYHSLKCKPHEESVSSYESPVQSKVEKPEKIVRFDNFTTRRAANAAKIQKLVSRAF